MKWCVHFPEEEILIKRPCLRKACLGNRSAATFLSFLLYRVSIHQEFQRSQSGPSSEMESQLTTNPTTIGITLTQQDIITQIDHEISDRTLRDTAIPLLIALDYLDIGGISSITHYIVHLIKIQAGIDHPPTRAEILPRCQRLSEDGTFSVAYRKFFHRLAEEIPIEGGNSSVVHRNFFRHPTEEIPVQSGNSSVTTNRLQGAGSQTLQPFSPDLKNKKSNKEKNTEREKILEEGQQPPEAKVLQSPLASNATAAAIFTSHDTYFAHEDQSSQATTKTEIDTILQPPESQTPRSVDAVLHLIEEARGQRFLEPERQQQAQAATLLLRLQPPFSLQDIQEAWHHGSDAYWRQHHDQRGMTLIDLAHHNKHGIRRIVATLEHKRRQQQTSQGHQEQIRSYRPTVQTQPSWKGATMTEQEAQQLVQRIEHDSQTHTLHLHATCAYEHHNWVVNVQIGLQSSNHP